MSRRKTVRKALAKAPVVVDVREFAADFPSSVPHPHRPTPTSELSWPRKLRRGFGFLLFLSSIALGVSAATASSDWNVKSGDYEPS